MRMKRAKPPQVPPREELVSILYSSINSAFYSCFLLGSPLCVAVRGGHGGRAAEKSVFSTKGEFTVNRYIRLGGLLLCAASLTACATITRGTRQWYVIETNPAGAQVALSSGQSCVSPCRLKLKRRPGFTVTATMDGYEPAEATVDSRIRGGGIAGAAGNLLVGGIVGGIVDGTNGSMNDLMPNPLRITMTPVGAAGAVAAAEAAPAEAAEPAPEPAPEPQGE